jgi:hypothetical protein
MPHAPRLTGLGAALALVGLGVALGSCGEGNPGFDPPPDQITFPSGVLLDPRVDSSPTTECMSDDECGAGELCDSRGWCRASARWLMVTNANSDRRYNAGSLLAIDLDRWWDAAFGDPGAVRPAGARLHYELEGPAASNCNAVTDAACCRRVANLPQVIECLEEPFAVADATVHFGNFPGPASAWNSNPEDGEAMILVPVRGDPSITYIELTGGLGDGNLRFRCGQASDKDGRRRCDDRHRLRFLRNDPDARRLAREPFRMLVSADPELPLAYVTHQGAQDLTVINLDGLDLGGDGRPAIVHQAPILVFEPNPTLFSVQGGFGLAQRPCDVEAGNAPSVTLGCTRPLVYAGLRWQLAVHTFTAVRRQPVPGSNQRCIGPDELGTIGGIFCEYQAETVSRFGFSGLSLAGIAFSSRNPLLGEIGFSRTGNELYVVQTNPGGLIRIDTSLDVDDDPVHVHVGQVEVCAQPTSLLIYDDGANEYGLVTCYRSGEVFIVDLASLTVVGLSRAGIGPDAMAADVAREVVYVANSLDATVSVIDMSRTRPSRFTEIGRIGLQEPYTE